MDKRNKKILAREFLLFLCFIILSIIIFYSWTRIENIKQNNYKNRISTLDSLTSYDNAPYRLRVFYLLNRDILKDSEKINSATKFIKDIQIEKNTKIWFNKVKEYFELKDTSYQKFYKQISTDKESEKVLKTIKKLENQTKFPPKKRIRSDKILISILSAFGILFLLRYLIYSIIWSVKQLKD